VSEGIPVASAFEREVVQVDPMNAGLVPPRPLRPLRSVARICPVRPRSFYGRVGEAWVAA
jgi:hypothetical protein